MRKFIRNNLLGFILGAIIFSSVTYAATLSFDSGNVDHTKADNTKTTVKAAINELYSKAENMTNGYRHVVNLGGSGWISGNMGSYYVDLENNTGKAISGSFNTGWSTITWNSSVPNMKITNVTVSTKILIISVWNGNVKYEGVVAAGDSYTYTGAYGGTLQVWW